MEKFITNRFVADFFKNELFHLYNIKKYRSEIQSEEMHIKDVYELLDEFNKHVKTEKQFFDFIESFEFRKAYRSFYLKKVPLKLSNMVFTYNFAFKENLYFTEPFSEETIYKKYANFYKFGAPDSLTYQIKIDEYAETDEMDYIASNQFIGPKRKIRKVKRRIRRKGKRRKRFLLKKHKKKIHIDSVQNRIKQLKKVHHQLYEREKEFNQMKHSFKKNIYKTNRLTKENKIKKELRDCIRRLHFLIHYCKKKKRVKIVVLSKLIRSLKVNSFKISSLIKLSKLKFKR